MKGVDELRQKCRDRERGEGLGRRRRRCRGKAEKAGDERRLWFQHGCTYLREEGEGAADPPSQAGVDLVGHRHEMADTLKRNTMTT